MRESEGKEKMERGGEANEDGDREIVRKQEIVEREENNRGIDREEGN